MVCVGCALKFLLETDLNDLEANAMASLPDNLITAIAPLPDGVAKATIVSLCILEFFTAKVL